jgi:Ca2+/H+ antiporter, TMEM165/GDT1 family
MRRVTKGQKILFFVLMAVLAVFVFGSVVMLLWNNVLVPVIHVASISFVQALGILVLSKLLFGGFRGGQWGRHQWKHRMMHRWDNMSAEEREKFQQEWKNRCGRRSEKREEEKSAS